MKKHVFKTKEYFQKYISYAKPEQIFLDEFDEEIAYIERMRYEGGDIRCIIGRGTIFVGDVIDLGNHFKEGMYVKLEN